MTLANDLSSLKTLRAPEDEVSRLELLNAARSLVARLETPHERVQVLGLHNDIVLNVLLTTVDMGLWTAWAADRGNVKTLEQLASLANSGCGCDPSLLRRLLRVLVAMHMLEETTEDTYKSTAFSQELGDESSAAFQALQWGQYTSPPTQNMPKFLAESKYRQPSRPDACPYSDYSSGLTMFKVMKTDDDMNQCFNGYMSLWAKTKSRWIDIIDTKAALLQDPDVHTKDTPLLVDVGGGQGTDIAMLLDQHPNLPSGKLVLQDQPQVIANLQLDERISVMAYDFFQPQTVQGARAYFLHTILHNWPDDKTEHIIVNQARAMKKGYSKLLICDIVLPNVGASITQATIDLRMLILFGAKERSEAAYAELLRRAGLKIMKVWWDPRGLEAVIEAELE